MSFPFNSECNFEDGTKGHFTSETDSESRLDFPHYVTLSAVPRMPAPFRGAYCMRVALANDGSPADAYLQEDTLWDLAANETRYFRFYFFLSSDLVMANNDEFIIFQLQSAGPTSEVVVAVNFTTANGLRIGIGETAGSSFRQLTLGEWHCFELLVDIDNAGSNDGTIDAWLDGAAFTQVATLDQGVIIQGRVGSMSQDAGTTTGTLLFDQIVSDDTRIGPIAYRWPQEVLLTKTGHAFVGPGEISDVRLLSGNATDCSLAIYDTDVGSTTDPGNFRIELKNIAALEPVPSSEEVTQLRRGCYVVLGGTNPRALVRVKRAGAYFSDGAIKTFGNKRVAHPLSL